jgi:hypothetical protein
MIHFLTLKLRMMSFGMSFLLPGPRNMSYLCTELNQSRTNMMLQLKISHGLTNIVVIDRFLILIFM